MPRDPTSMTATSQSPARHTSRATRSSTRCARFSPRRPATEDDLECGPFEGGAAQAQLLREARRHAALCRGGLADRGLPPDGASVPAGDAQPRSSRSPRRSRPGWPSTGAASSPSRSRSSGWPHVLALCGARRATASPADARIPELIRGPQALDTDLMRALPGWIAKGGAEGLLCAAGPDGLGLALKVEDGASRALGRRSARSSTRYALDGPRFAQCRFAIVETSSSVSSRNDLSPPLKKTSTRSGQ